MSRSPALVTISFRKPGTRPPLFLAGSFSHPPWQPREMQWVTDEAGERHFTAQVSVQPGQQYHYRFRTGDDDWLLDEHSSIVTDDQGIKANLLTVPAMSGSPAQPQTPLEATESESHHAMNAIDAECDSPFEHAAGTAPVEPPDTAAWCDDPENLPLFSSYPFWGGDDVDDDDGDDLKIPLFAHESFRPCDPADDGLGHSVYDPNAKCSAPRSSLNASAMDKFDIDDPTIEKFPSEPSSILSTLRKLQSSLDENRVGLSVSSAETAARSSVGSSEASPGLPPTRRENRLSHSSLGPPRSPASLGSIAE